ncbi:MAG: hypothetical protein MHM6MM_001002 [Cercozoa sp. M6MM]
MSNFLDVLSAAASQTGDDSVRHQATQQLLQLRQSDGNAYLSSLAEVLAGHPEPHLRQFAAILLRQLCAISMKDTTWTEAPQEVRGKVQQALLSCLGNEQEHAVVRAVAQCVAAIYGREVVQEKRQWNDVAQAVQAMSQVTDADVARQEAALILLRYVCEYSPAALEDAGLANFLSQFCGRVISSANASPTCRVAAISCSRVALHAKPDLVVLHPLIAASLQALVDAKDEDFAAQVCSELNELFDAAPDVFGNANNLEQAVRAVLSVVERQDIESDTRQRAYQSILTLLSVQRKLARALPLTDPLALLVFEFAAVYDDTLTFDDIENDAEQDGIAFAIQAANQLPDILSEERLVAVLLPRVQQELQSADWKRRQGALAVLGAVISRVASAIGNAQANEMRSWLLECDEALLGEDEVDAFLERCLPLMQDSTRHFRVHAMIDTLVCITLDRVSATKVVRHFSDLLGCFLQHMQRDNGKPEYNLLARRTALGCTATIAQSTSKIVEEVDEDETHPFYAFAQQAHAIMRAFYQQAGPTLLQLAMADETGNPEQDGVRDQAMFAVGYIGQSVPELFRPHALQMLPKLVQVAHIPNAQQLLGHVATVLGADFVPFLPQVMNALNDTMQVDASQLLEMHEPVPEHVNAANGYLVAEQEIPGVGMRRLVLNNSLLQAKNYAVGLVLEMAMNTALQQAMAPLVPPLLASCLPLVEYVSSADIRTGSIKVLPELFNCLVVAQAPDKVLKENFVKILNVLKSRIQSEQNADVTVALLSNIGDLLRYYPAGLTSSVLMQVGETINEAIDSALYMRNEVLKVLAKTRQGQTSYEEEDLQLDEFYERENPVLATAVQLSDTVFSLVGDRWLKTWQRKLVPLAEMLIKKADSIFREDPYAVAQGVFLFVDPLLSPAVSPAAKKDIVKGTRKLVSPLLNVAGPGAHSELRRAAQCYVQAVSGVVPAKLLPINDLVRVVGTELSVSLETEAFEQEAHDAALAAAATMLKKHRSKPNVSSLLQPFFASLPAESALDNRECFSALVELAQQQVLPLHEASLLPQWLAVLGFGIMHSSPAAQLEQGELPLSEHVFADHVGAIREMLKSLLQNEAAVQQAAQSLSPESQQWLQLAVARVQAGK